MLDFIKANFTVLLLSFFIILFTGITLLVFAKFGGSKDVIQVCGKDAADAYDWRAIY